MQGLRETAIAVCAMMIVCSVVSMLSPGEKFERVMKNVLAAVMLVTIVSGLMSADLSFLTEGFDVEIKSDQSEFSGKVLSFAESSVESVSRDILMQQLDANDVECKNITFEINTSEQGSISIDRVTLEIPSAASYDEAKRIAKQVLGEGTDVVIIGM